MGFNGQEREDNLLGIGKTNFAKYWMYEPHNGIRWNMDPKTRPGANPYTVFNDNPILFNDILGDDPNEYDKNSNQISNLGRDKIDFHHQENGDTKITDRESGATNIIRDGERLIKGYKIRDEQTGLGEVTYEFIMQQGPDNSLFADFDESNKGPFASLHSARSFYSAPAREMMLGSKLSKGVFEMDYNNANPIAAKDMWEQMWGRSNVS